MRLRPHVLFPSRKQWTESLHCENCSYSATDAVQSPWKYPLLLAAHLRYGAYLLHPCIETRSSTPSWSMECSVPGRSLLSSHHAILWQQSVMCWCVARVMWWRVAWVIGYPGTRVMCCCVAWVRCWCVVRVCAGVYRGVLASVWCGLCAAVCRYSAVWSEHALSDITFIWKVLKFGFRGELVSY